MFVQHLDTGLFLRSDRAWVREQDQPLFFPDATTAITFCERHDLTNVRLVQHSLAGASPAYFYPFAQHAAFGNEFQQNAA
jgi:hypothetical protein